MHLPRVELLVDSIQNFVRVKAQIHYANLATFMVKIHIFGFFKYSYIM